MTDPKTIELNFELICNGCKQPLEVHSSEHMTRGTRIYIEVCDRCTEETVNVNGLAFDFNGEKFEVAVD